MFDDAYEGAAMWRRSGVDELRLDGVAAERREVLRFRRMREAEHHVGEEGLMDERGRPTWS
ncbi:hypothetical protein ABZ897_50655 [Nonomuraea sp. NPDC046802]|uniref:hypothetical protein n=1 Tax=Nonomuraea sp. NPDC046802 TaxID=3154919 RepID=UPI0034013311